MPELLVDLKAVHEIKSIEPHVLTGFGDSLSILNLNGCTSHMSLPTVVEELKALQELRLEEKREPAGVLR